MSEPIDILLAVAHELELGALTGALSPELQAEIGGRRIAARVLGVGLPAATVGATLALAELRPAALLLLGSYGRYPGASTAGTHAPGAELLVPTSVQVLDPAVVAHEAAFPAPMPTRCATDGAMSDSLASSSGALRAVLGVTAAITTDDGLAFRLAAAGCHGENLEAFGVALACEHLGVPFAALLGCTNEVGAAGRSQWQQHHAAAARATGSAVLTWLRA